MSIPFSAPAAPAPAAPARPAASAPAPAAPAFSALHCDLYELTMAQGYWRHSRNFNVVFDMFIRRQPFAGGFTVCAGLATALEYIQRLRFSAEDIAYLRTLGYFRDDFLAHLRQFRFTGTVYAVDEGQIIFPDEPIARVHASLIEAQIIEGLLLNVINYQSLIATKTARMYLASQRGKIMEFGMRRAHGVDGALSASRAAYIGGASATSFVAAGKRYGIPVSGTMAHSWVMSFSSEERAFDAFVSVYRDNPAYKDNMFLILDTYNSLQSGIREAINIGVQLQKRGINIGVRLDSGDIQYLSTKVRALLDQAGLRNAKIAISNDLDEHIIHQLVTSDVPVDVWAVGTRLITGYPDASLTGVYKLAAKEREGESVPVMKVSDNPAKSTNPGIKEVYRFYDQQGDPQADLITLADEKIAPNTSIVFHHPSKDYRYFVYRNTGTAEPLLRKYMDRGAVCRELPALADIRSSALANLYRFDPAFLRLLNPHIYRVSISEALKDTKARLIAQATERQDAT